MKTLQFFMAIYFTLFSSHSFAKYTYTPATEKEEAQEVAGFAKMVNEKKTVEGFLAFAKEAKVDIGDAYTKLSPKDLKSPLSAKAENRKVTMMFNGQAVDIEVVNLEQNKIKINGYEIVYDESKPFADQVKLVQKILEKTAGKKTSWMDLAMPKAHAIEPFTIAVLIAIVAAIITGLHYLFADVKELKDVISELRKVEAIEPNLKIGYTCKNTYDDPAEPWVVMDIESAEGKLSFGEDRKETPEKYKKLARSFAACCKIGSCRNKVPTIGKKLDSLKLIPPTEAKGGAQ